MADELILILDFGRAPPSAEDLGEVFSALARDYRETTKGRTLVVIRVDSGSIIATLTDAAIAAARYARPAAEGGHAVITAINALATFAENLKKWFGYASRTRTRTVSIGKVRNLRVSYQSNRSSRPPPIRAATSG